jgi:hypothetical protein
MEFRPTAADLPMEIEIDDFCELVRQGQVPPTALYRTKWTKGEWRTVDNFRPFHKHSPTPYPPGEHLRVLLEREQREEEDGQQLAELLYAYEHGSLIEEVFRLAPLADVASAAAGAARFFVKPAFDPETVVTVVFQAPVLTVETVQGHTSLWYAAQPINVDRIVADLKGTGIATDPFDPGQAVRSAATVAYGNVPAPFQSWDRFAALARAAVSCMTPNLRDGIGYRHKVCDQGHLIDVSWWNPVPEDHPIQCRLIDAYSRLLEQAAL